MRLGCIVLKSLSSSQSRAEYEGQYGHGGAQRSLLHPPGHGDVVPAVWATVASQAEVNAAQDGFTQGSHGEICRGL